MTGAIAAYIDSEGRVRAVTARCVSVDALKYDVVALFSTSLRSPECILTDYKRGRRIEIPFKFVMHCAFVGVAQTTAGPTAQTQRWPLRMHVPFEANPYCACASGRF